MRPLLGILPPATDNRPEGFIFYFFLIIIIIYHRRPPPEWEEWVI